MLRDSPNLINAGLIGLLAGVGGYVFACAAHVWRKRNRSTALAGGVSRPRRMASWSTGMVLLGLLVIGGVAGWRELVPREGHLTGEGLLTVRVPADQHVAEVTSQDRVAKGAVLARFSCPRRESRIRVLQLHREALEARKAILANAPLALDPELVRRYQDAATDRRQMCASLDQLAPARDLVLRERLRQRLDNRWRLKVLAGGVEQADRELAQAKAKLSYLRKALQRKKLAAARGVATPEEVQGTETDVQVSEEEVGKVRAKLDALKAERTELQETLEEYEAVAAQQAKGLSEEVTTAERSVAHAGRKAESLLRQLDRDAERARDVRRGELEQLDAEIAQTTAEREGLEESLVVEASFGGTIVYREPSPRTAGREAPLVVLAGKNALRLRLRLSAAEADALAKETEVLLSLDQPDVQKRFAGIPLSSKPLPAEPGYVAAEVACRPPGLVVRELVDNPRIPVGLTWRPPLTVYPLLWIGVALVALGASGRIAVAWVARRAEAHGGQAVPQDRSARPAPDGGPEGFGAPDHDERTADLEAALDPAGGSSSQPEVRNAPARLMHILGEQLRDMLADGRRDEALLRALEYVLEHGCKQAVVSVRQGLNGDPAVHERIRKIEESVGRMSDPVEERLVRVLRTVADDVLSERPALR